MAMRRATDPAIAHCAHGYERLAARRDCPRCADREPVAISVAPRFPVSRWDPTDTTLGPRWKVAITAAIVLPLLFMIWELHFAPGAPAMTFWVVPLAGLSIFAVQFLPELWAPGRVHRSRVRRS
jgi:hypothetical protein